MKTPVTLLLSLYMITHMHAQNHLQVAEHSTVHLLCPEAVSYVQPGSHRKLLAEAIDDYPNIVRIKALEAFRDTSSLTLICHNKLYAFKVSYHSQCPLQLKLYDYKGEGIKELPGAQLPLHQILACMDKLQRAKACRKNIASHQQCRVELILEDIRVRQGLLFIRLTIRNHSNLRYKAQVPTFLMRDRKPRKAANVQEYAIEPIRLSDMELEIAPKKATTMIFVFNGFTIPRHKQVEISLREETEVYTGRDLKLNFDNKAIVKAKPL